VVLWQLSGHKTDTVFVQGTGLAFIFSVHKTSTWSQKIKRDGVP